MTVTHKHLLSFNNMHPASFNNTFLAKELLYADNVQSDFYSLGASCHPPPRSPAPHQSYRNTGAKQTPVRGGELEFVSGFSRGQNCNLIAKAKAVGQMLLPLHGAVGQPQINGSICRVAYYPT